MFSRLKERLLKPLGALTLILALVAPAAAGAEPHGHHEQERGGGSPHAGEERGGERGPGRWRDERPEGRFGYGPPRGEDWRSYPEPPPLAPRSGAPVGWGEPLRESWRRGQFLPPQARGGVVEDFARYHLRRPPRGYVWYRAGDDFVLASHGSGVIFEVIPTEGY
jgi:Ni/Co efflux regulator RcnB